MSQTAIYISKDGKGTKVTVNMPFYGLVTYKGADGQPVTEPRSTFQEKFEPQLPAASLNPGEQAPRTGASPEAIAALHETLSGLHHKVDTLLEALQGTDAKVSEMHALVAKPEEKQQTEG